MVDSVLARVVMRADPSQVAGARRLVRDELADVVTPAVLDDVQLVVSELVTNAVFHGTSGPITLVISRSSDMIAVTVVSVGPSPDVGPVPTWTISEAPDVMGRGLGIVRRIADRVDVEQTADTLIVTAYHRVSGP